MGPFERQKASTWSDTEVERISDDRLDRAQFSSTVASLIGSIPLGCHSTVYGIVGPWGGGKSSILNLVRNEIADQPNPLAVVEFNPWAMSDSTGLLLEFFDTLVSADVNLRTTALKQSLRKFFTKCAPVLSAIPLIGQGASKTAENFLGGHNLAQEFAQIDKLIASTKVRVLIIVDDVDRLNGDELKTLIKTIRMLGRFRNVHYLLAYDQDALIDVMKSNLGGDPERARAFLEKIVQYPLSIPPAQVNHLSKILEEEIRNTIEDVDQENEVDLSGLGFFLAIFETDLHRNLNTVRSVLRFCVQVDLYYRLLQDEVDLSDFLFLTYLRFFYPSVYSRIFSWKSEITGKLEDIDEENLSDEVWDRRVSDAGITKLTEREHIVDILKLIFPDISDRTIPPSMSSRDYFDRYLVFGIPEGDVADQIVNGDVTIAATRDWPEFRVEDYQRSFTSPSHGTRSSAIKKASEVILMEPGEVPGVLNFFVWLQTIDPHSRRIADQQTIRWLAKLLLEHPPSDGSRVKEILTKLPTAVLLCEALIEADSLKTSNPGPSYQSDLSFPAREHVVEAVAIIAAREIQTLISQAHIGSTHYGFMQLHKQLNDLSLIKQTKTHLKESICGDTTDAVALATLFIGRPIPLSFESLSRQKNQSKSLVISDVYNLIGVPLLRSAAIGRQDREEMRADDDEYVRSRKIAAAAILDWQAAMDEP